jgi:molybdopterin synthase sulfur carrier subunit
VPRLRLFGPAREITGTSNITIPGKRVSDVIAEAERQFGESFSRIVATSNIWLNGECVEPDALVSDSDEVAVIPPVSGG